MIRISVYQVRKGNASTLTKGSDPLKDSSQFSPDFCSHVNNNSILRENKNVTNYTTSYVDDMLENIYISKTNTSKEDKSSTDLIRYILLSDENISGKYILPRLSGISYGE